MPPRTLLPLDVLRHGSTKPLETRVPLRAGPLTLDFDSETGWIRHIRWGEHEVLRALYAAVRDRHWRTIKPQLHNLEMQASADRFQVTFSAECVQPPIDFVWQCIFKGDADGTLQYRFEGQARSRFWRARIGCCVLHPIEECAGRPCVVEHVDGSLENSHFPKAIAPHQPFLSIRALSYEIIPGLSAAVRFEGDEFETEDQRNWTDSSFKTYCTPLAQPWPLEVPKGTKVQQSVTLRLQGAAPAPPSVHERTPRLCLRGGHVVGFPFLGLGVATHELSLTPRETTLLRALRLHHLRAEIFADTTEATAKLNQAIAQARLIGTSLEIALFLGGDVDGALTRLTSALKGDPAPIGRWLIFPGLTETTPAGLLRCARQHLQPISPEARFAAGTNGYFAQFNRQPPAMDNADLACFSLNPQVHAFDDLSLMEALHSQVAVVEQAQQLARGLPIAVTPITLKPRFNPHDKQADAENHFGRVPENVDTRQASLFAAAWTLGSICSLAKAGTASATYFETTGWRGVIDTEHGTPLLSPLTGAVFPVYHLLADLAEASGVKEAACQVLGCREVVGLALAQGSVQRLLLANLTPIARTVEVDRADFWGQSGARIRFLDESTAEWAMRSPEAFRADPGASWSGETVSLRPYSLVRIDATGDAE